MTENKSKIIVALDVSEEDKALELVDSLVSLTPYFKVGLELYCHTGSYIINMIKEKGGQVFLDLKFHDIPNTVAGAMRAAVARGIFMVNLHATGGEEMLKAATEAVQEESARLKVKSPLVVGITVLTSLSPVALEQTGVSRSPAEQVVALARLCYDCGLQGVVASAREAKILRQELGSDFKIVTPGVRPQGDELQDQKRVMTPRKAVEAGSDYLVIGRPITKALDPYTALKNIQESIKK